MTAPISVHINGCPNSCARIQTADIGLKGQIVTDADGNQVEGFQVHLGGGLGLDAGFGRKLRGHKVTGDELTDYVERVVRNFVADREPEERFAQWVGRADGGGAQVTERATPFYCPYCGDEDLRPQEEPHAAWLCTGCRRVFTVTPPPHRSRGQPPPATRARAPPVN